MRSSEIQSDEMACGKNAVIYNQSKFITSQKNCEDDTASETWVNEYKLDLEVVLGVCVVYMTHFSCGLRLCTMMAHFFPSWVVMATFLLMWGCGCVLCNHLTPFISIHSAAAAHKTLLIIEMAGCTIYLLRSFKASPFFTFVHEPSLYHQQPCGRY